ncbi:single-stranded DNA-binding protein [Bartonella sp. DGB1]|uniref:single-stranded DNA-binding protein n=1 Tax=Bartonella sp. DGB1 TaxID=3239807 RepID=UPI0035257D83
MAGSINKVILVGNLGTNPESRRFASGDLMVSFSIATSETWKDRQSGEKREKTEWHNIVVLNETIAKFAESYLKKGNKIYLEGQLQTRKWQDKEGKDRYTTEVVIPRFRGDLQILDSRNQGDNSVSQTNRFDNNFENKTNTDNSNNKHSMADFDDEIPF